MSNEISNRLLLDEIIKNRQEIKTTIETVEAKLLKEIGEQKLRVDRVEEQQLEITNKIEKLERKNRENNIIIFGLQKKPEEINTEYIIGEIKRLFEIDIKVSDLNKFYTLGRTENCPIKIEFVSHLKEISILENARKLKGTNISVVHDMTESHRKENRILRKHLLKARNNGNIGCYIKKDKLYINNSSYTASELEEDADIVEVTEPLLRAVEDREEKDLAHSAVKDRREVREGVKKAGKEAKEAKVATRSKK